MPDKIIAYWSVAGETYQQMVEEAVADAHLFMHGSPDKWAVDVINCTGDMIEGNKITMWRGQALITTKVSSLTSHSPVLDHSHEH